MEQKPPNDLIVHRLTILLTSHELNGVAAHLPWLICFKQGIVAQGRPEDVLTWDILRTTYASEMHVLQQHSYTLIANRQLADRGRHSNCSD